MHNAIFVEYVMFYQELLKFSVVELTTKNAQEVCAISLKHKSC